MNVQAMVTTLVVDREVAVDEARLAAAAFLARYSRRILEAYRHDLRMYFQWALDNELEVLAATRPHLELSESSTRTCSGPGSSWPPSTPAYRSAMFRSLPATPTRETTTIYDRRREMWWRLRVSRGGGFRRGCR